MRILISFLAFTALVSGSLRLTGWLSRKRDNFRKLREEMKIWHSKVCNEGINAILDYAEKTSPENEEVKESVDFLKREWGRIREYVLWSYNDCSKKYLIFFINTINHELSREMDISEKIDIFHSCVEENWNLLDLVPSNRREMQGLEVAYFKLKKKMEDALSLFERDT